MKDEMNQFRSLRIATISTLTLVGLGLTACGSRNDDWNSYFEAGEVVGLDGSVAVFDRGLERILFLTAPSSKQVASRAFSVGHDVQVVRASKDRSSLFVLSAGEWPRTEPDDEKPRLQVFSGGPKLAEPTVYELDDPMGALALDPEGRWVAAFAGSATVTNPNEIVLLDLQDPKAKPVSKTIRSFGGSPVELSFTSELAVPRGPARRFLVARTDRDVALIDLSDPNREEITVGLPKDEQGIPRVPVQIVHDDGDPDDKSDARLAVRLVDSADVVLLELAEPTAADRDFSVGYNIVDVGGVPTAIDFVRTDGGLRLAALVPSRQRATLVNPETTLAEVVDLGGNFSSMTRITNAVGDAPEGGDVALLWGEGKTFAFWSLGSTSGTPYRAVDSTELDIQLSQLLDVPAPNEHLKVLVGESATTFYVLNLERRESFPLMTREAGYRIEVSGDGNRLWAYAPGNPSFSAVRLSDLHPTQLDVYPEPSVVFDVARLDGGRAGLAIQTSGGLSVTLLDANDPDSATTRYFPALELEEIQ